MNGEVIEAVVQVGVDETRYLRCGRGERTVLVLANEPMDREWLMSRFGATHRVIAPLPGTCAADGGDTAAIESWLRGVMDGLGLERPMVALAPELAWLADRLARDCGDALDIVLTVAQRDS